MYWSVFANKVHPDEIPSWRYLSFYFSAIHAFRWSTWCQNLSLWHVQKATWSTHASGCTVRLVLIGSNQTKGHFLRLYSRKLTPASPKALLETSCFSVRVFPIHIWHLMLHPLHANSTAPDADVLWPTKGRICLLRIHRLYAIGKAERCQGPEKVLIHLRKGWRDYPRYLTWCV